MGYYKSGAPRFPRPRLSKFTAAPIGRRKRNATHEIRRYIVPGPSNDAVFLVRHYRATYTERSAREAVRAFTEPTASFHTRSADSRIHRIPPSPAELNYAHGARSRIHYPVSLARVVLLPQGFVQLCCRRQYHVHGYVFSSDPVTMLIRPVRNNTGTLSLAGCRNPYLQSVRKRLPSCLRNPNYKTGTYSEGVCPGNLASRNIIACGNSV